MYDFLYLLILQEIFTSESSGENPEADFDMENDDWDYEV